MRILKSSGFIALALTVAACESAPTAGPDIDAAANFTNGPANPSAVVIRVDGAPFAAIFNDPDRGLISVHGIDPDDFLFCGGTGGVGEIDMQIVDTPSEVERLTTLFRSRDVRVTVFDTGDLPDSLQEFCELIAGPLRIGQGGEDVVGAVSRGSNNLSFTFRFVGVLEGVDGSTIHYNEVQKFITGQGFVVEDIILRSVDGY